MVRFSEETRRRDRDSLFYAPPGGESLVHVLSRVDGVLTNFNRQCANRRCIVVCHGEVMWAFRLRFERLSQLTYREMEAASNPHERIHNCQVRGRARTSRSRAAAHSEVFVLMRVSSLSLALSLVCALRFCGTHDAIHSLAKSRDSSNVKILRPRQLTTDQREFPSHMLTSACVLACLFLLIPREALGVSMGSLARD